MEERHFACLAGVLDGGPDGGAPLVLLHGLTFDRAMWRPALDGLGQIDPARQVLALDLPGHGGSAAWPRYAEEGRGSDGEVRRFTAAASVRSGACSE